MTLPPAVDLGDPLTEVLRHLHMDGVFYCVTEVTAPWGADMPPMPGSLWFHVVVRGGGLLIDATGAEHRLDPGDVVVLPHGNGHTIVDRVGSPTPQVLDLHHDYESPNYAVLRHGSGGEATTLLCGVVTFTHPAARTLAAVLPEVIRLAGTDDTSAADTVRPLVELMGAETRRPLPGGEAVVTRLCDVLVVQAIRSWLTTADAPSGWVGALHDPQIGGAIAAMHREPGEPWSVASLAAYVGMSRSAFAARFSDLVGESPLAYLTTWRMALAQDRLATTDVTVLELALSLGYTSEASFSRAFSREVGRPPSRCRARPTPQFG